MSHGSTATAAPIPFTRLLAQRRVEAGRDAVRVAFEVSDDWAQGRTAFGGLTSAFGVQGMRDLPGSPAGFALRALQTSFVGPVGCGSLHVDAMLLREGRNVRQAQAILYQGGRIAAVMLGTFGRARESSMQPQGLQRPAATRAPEQLPAASLGDDAPQFLRHFDLRWDHGPTPGSSDPGLSTRIHMRLLGEDGLDDELATVLLADVSPTPATGQFARRPPASSVSWALELRPLAGPSLAGGWWRADNDSLVVGQGYVNHAARLWAPSGELAALGCQLVAIFG